MRFQAKVAQKWHKNFRRENPSRNRERALCVFSAVGQDVVVEVSPCDDDSAVPVISEFVDMDFPGANLPVKTRTGDADVFRGVLDRQEASGRCGRRVRLVRLAVGGEKGVDGGDDVIGDCHF